MAQMTDSLARAILRGDGYTRHEVEQLCHRWLSQSQQEAPGAVAGWSEAEQRATLVNSLRASKSWMTGYAEAFVDAFQDHARTTPPAPVDVRKLRELANELRNEAGDWDIGSTRGALQDAANRIEALLDGQPAGVGR